MTTVLYLSYTGMTDPLGQSQVLAYLRKLSVTGNYRFTIISFEKPDAYRQLRTTIEGICAEAGIKWYPLPYTAKPPVVSTFRDVQRMKQLAVRLTKEQCFSIVHCRSYIPSIVGLHLKKHRGIPFLFDMRGFWADERLDGNIWKLSNPVYKVIYNYFKKKEKQFLLNADHIVSLTNNARNVINSWQLRPANLPITVIPCCVDLTLFAADGISPQAQNEARSSLQIPADAKVISYVGSLGTWYMLPEMMLFVKQYFQAFPNAYFMVLTGEPEQMVIAAAQAAGVDVNRLRVKKAARSEMPVYVSLSTISIFFIKPAFSKRASSPVKQGELMAMGIPIVCNDSVGDTSEIVNTYEAGVVLDDFSQQSFTNALKKLETTVFDKRKIIQGAREVFSLEQGVELYSSVYRKILNG